MSLYLHFPLARQPPPHLPPLPSSPSITLSPRPFCLELMVAREGGRQREGERLAAVPAQFRAEKGGRNRVGRGGERGRRREGGRGGRVMVASLTCQVDGVHTVHAKPEVLTLLLHLAGDAQFVPDLTDC